MLRTGTDGPGIRTKVGCFFGCVWGVSLNPKPLNPNVSLVCGEHFPPSSGDDVLRLLESLSFGFWGWGFVRADSGTRGVCIYIYKQINVTYVYIYIYTCIIYVYIYMFILILVV